METKRTILALSLSLLVLISWSLLTSKMQPAGNKDVTTVDTRGTSPAQKVVQTHAKIILPEPHQAPLLQINSGALSIYFSEKDGAIEKVVFPAYHNYEFKLQNGFAFLQEGVRFKKESDTDNSIRFIVQDTEKKFTKEFNFSKSNYGLGLEIKILNTTSTALTMPINFIGTVVNFKEAPEQARFQDLVIALNDKVLHTNARKSAEFSNIKFISWKDHYFCGIIEPQEDDFSVKISKQNADYSIISLKSKDYTINPGEEIKKTFKIYLGPQDENLLTSFNNDWKAVIHYGTFDSISRLLVRVLRFIYALTHNWGLAILILSVLIYFMLYPLTLKQMRSMKEMQALQPKIEELRKTYKDNPQKLNKEIMDLYREHKVNPFGGCLPLVLQIPIFFALYQALLRSIELKGAGFLWIRDLSLPDRLFVFPQNARFIVSEINILPILMAIAMFFQQKISGKTTGGISSEQQKMMLIIFPVMFGIIFYQMPSGLVLYWFINSLLTVFFQFRLSVKNESKN